MSASPDSQTVLALEEVALNAWPALSVMARDGWLLRLAAGFTKRANSVHALYPGREPIADKIAWAETVYRDAGRPAIFRLTPLAPAGLEEELARRDYRVVEPSLVQVSDLDPCWRHDAGVIISAVPDPIWTAAYARAAGLAPAQAEALAAMLAAVAAPVRLARIEQEGIPIAFGMAVVERGTVGFFDMLTLPDFRRQGCGRRIMASLFAWARGSGATRGTLQVVEANAPARELYGAFGFRPLYGYRYRVRPTA